ncbi:MAG: molybdenum cofactor sulfurase [Planctomycetes bacterium RBG_16_55_9]|nr:MAG: molybdenum cofactor sulfurase [Planctomycetes bacterium RBG_16_55_9]
MNVPEAQLQEDFGMVGDAHAGRWKRQISLLGVERIDTMDAKGLDLRPGDFAENITTEGIDLGFLAVGGRLRLGADVELEITQLGKVCHGRCKIFERIGDCVMPRDGVFARVTQGGSIHVGDFIEVIEDGDQSGHIDD